MPPPPPGTAASKLPTEIATDLKWYVWNSIWARVNSRLASNSEGAKKSELHKQAKQDVARADTHFKAALLANSFSKPTLQRIRRQVANIGSAASANFEGDFYACEERVEKAEVLQPPDEIEPDLWYGLVHAVKDAAVSANMMSLTKENEARSLQVKFERAWDQFEALNHFDDYTATDVDSARNAGAHAAADASDAPGAASTPSASASRRLPVKASADLKWFIWNYIWSALNASIKGQTERALKDKQRADVHFDAALKTCAFSDSTLLHLRRQVAEVGEAAVRGLQDGNWLLVAQAEVLAPPSEIEAQLWADIVRAVKCAGVAANIMSREHDANSLVKTEFDEAWSWLENMGGDRAP